MSDASCIREPSDETSRQPQLISLTLSVTMSEGIENEPLYKKIKVTKEEDTIMHNNNYADAAEAQIDQFQTSFNVTNDKIRVGKSSFGGNGIFLTSDVNTNETVLTIPLEVILTENIALKSVVGKSIKQVYGNNIPNRIILILYLLYI